MRIVRTTLLTMALATSLFITASSDRLFPYLATVNGASTQVEVILPVTTLLTSTALTGTQFKYPASVTALTSVLFAHALAAYGVDGTVLLAPKGWTGTGTMGVDGSATAMLHPQTSGVPIGHLAYENIPVCEWCAWAASAQYFSWAKRDWSMTPYYNETPPPARQLLHSVSLSHELLTFQAPPTFDGLETNGVAYSVVDRREFVLSTCAKCALFSREEVALPPNEHALATVLLNEFLSRIPRLPK